jgi:hypothetical protein
VAVDALIVPRASLSSAARTGSAGRPSGLEE